MMRHPGPAYAVPVLIAAGFFLGYLALATPRLTAQGLQYDELHQAPAAFAFVPGRNWAAAYSVSGLPALTMPYSGAIKSALYGAWLRVSGRPFTVASWRALGCLLAAGGILLVCASFARWVSAEGALVLGLFLITDATVLLATRHDWGPVALALALRLTLLALWARAWSRADARPGESVAMGFLLGLAVYEKLSSVVLVLPVAAAFLLDPERRRIRHLALGLLGGLAGAAPLVLVNVHSWVTTHALVSLSSDALTGEAFPPLVEFLGRYVTLGSGAVLREWILGDAMPPELVTAEGVLVALLCLTAALAAFRAPPRARRLRAGGVLAVLYVAVGLLVAALPADTWVHHWVIGTPFQYVSWGFLAGAVARGEVRGTVRGRALAYAFAPLLSLFLILRVGSVVPLERSLWAGHTSRNWHPSFTRLAEFAARQPADTMFVAGEWGLANQIRCIGDGRVSVPEPYWSYQGRHDLEVLLEGVPRFYLVAGNPAGEVPGQTQRILADARALDAFREVPVEAEVASLPAVQGWKFVRATGAAR